MERLFIEVRRMRAVLCRYMMYMLIAASLLHTSCSSAETIEISNQITKEAYLSHIVKAGDILSFEWEHSFEHVLWKEFYRVTDEHTFKLFTIAVQGFGAGIPAEMDCTYRYEDGFIYMENIEGSVFKEFNWIHSQTQLKQIILNDTVLIWGTELPPKSKNTACLTKEYILATENTVDQQALLEEFERESRTRNFVNPIFAKLLKWTALLVTFYHLAYASGYIRPETLRHRSIHVGMILFMTFAIYPAFKKSSRKVIAWYDYILMILSVVIPVYMWVNYQAIIDRVGDANLTDVIMGTILVALVIEAARRITGWALPIIGIIFMIYALMGARQGLIPINVPGLFLHRGFKWPKLIGHLFSNTEGIYGTSVNVSSTYIFLFIVFGEIMNKCGMGKFFNDIAIGLAGHTKGGPAKVAVIAAGLLGSINGSAIANVVTTGSFTIPLMKKIGYSKEFAGAVSSTASVGGQLLPPIMGAAAFIMAETLGIKYKEIVVAAAIPALIYYLGIIFQIQLRASKDKLDGMPKDQLPKVKETLKMYWHLTIPILFLVYMLFFSGYTVIKGAFLTILLTIVIAQLKKETRMSLKDIEDAFVASAKSTVSVAIACACVGIVIGVSSLTGFTINMASAIISLGGKSLLLTLVFTMVTCMLLGMGLPSIPAYIITVTIAAPALIELGIVPLAAHLFCFYFAMFANITPPVALASFAAAGISGGNPMKTGIVSIKLALAGFIIPYMFVYNNQLLLMNTNILQGIQVTITACVGVFLISAAVEGYFHTKANILMRLLMLAGAFLLIDSALLTDLAGVGIFVASIFIQRILARREARRAAA